MTHALLRRAQRMSIRDCCQIWICRSGNAYMLEPAFIRGSVLVCVCCGREVFR